MASEFAHPVLKNAATWVRLVQTLLENTSKTKTLGEQDDNQRLSWKAHDEELGEDVEAEAMTKMSMSWVFGSWFTAKQGSRGDELGQFCVTRLCSEFPKAWESSIVCGTKTLEESTVC